jgi:hypothetical protein
VPAVANSSLGLKVASRWAGSASLETHGRHLAKLGHVAGGAYRGREAGIQLDRSLSEARLGT